MNARELMNYMEKNIDGVKTRINLLGKETFLKLCKYYVEIFKDKINPETLEDDFNYGGWFDLEDDNFEEE